MATNLARQNKTMKRTLTTKKSHSWWWDSHISPKNSRWLQENLEEMDQHVKRMLKLIEEDADSFAKKAQMYYQKRPELVSLVEEFYRMYRSLAERYDQVTGELRKSVPSDLQSQASGISDASSEPPSSMPSPDRRPSRTKSGHRAAGFDFFLGASGNSQDVSSKDGNKDGDDLSTLGSESESDDSSINNYAATQSSDDDQGLRRRIMELEIELQNMKDKLETVQDGGSQVENCETHLSKIAGYEEELKLAGEKIRSSEEQISTLEDELQKYRSMDFSNGVQEGTSILESSSIMEKQVDGDLEQNIHPLEEEIRLTKGKLLDSEKEVVRLTMELKNNGTSIQALQDQLRSAQKDSSSWKSKFDKERKEVLKLQDRISRYKSNLADREQEIRGLRETIGNANKVLAEENSELQAEIARLMKEKTYLEHNLKEIDHRCQSLEEDVRRIKAAKEEMEGILEGEMEELKDEIVEKNDHIAELNRNLDSLRVEKDALDLKIASHVEEIKAKDAQMNEMNMHLHQLHLEHVQLITQAEGAHKQVEEMGSKIKEMERDVERKQELILESAEEKREAIRQLCFSLEHYRNDYHRLREAFVGHRPVMAS